MNPSENGGAVVFDPGAPMVHDRETPVVTKTQEKAPEKTEAEKQVERLERENSELRRNAEFWATRAKGPEQRQVEQDDEPEPIVKAATPPNQTTDEFLNSLNAEGREALKKNGFLTEEQLAGYLEKFEERISSRYAADQAGRTFDDQMNREFPELLADNARVDRGESPTSPIYLKTAANYRELARDAGVTRHDTQAARGLMLAAARMAKKEIDMEGADNGRTNADRRDRIAAQSRSGRGGGDDHTGEQPSQLSEVQRQIIGNLASFGLTPEKYKQYQGSPSARRNVGG